MTTLVPAGGEGGSIDHDEQYAAREASRKKKAIVSRLSTLIRVISGKMNLTVTTEIPDIVRQYCSKHERGDPDHDWYRWAQYLGDTCVQEFVHIPTNDLEDITAAKGKAAHEAAHVRIDRNATFVPDSVLQELGFSAVLHAVEERPTDECVRRLHPIAGEWLDHARLKSVREGSAVQEEPDGASPDFPKFLQLCDLIQYEPQLSPRAIRQKYDPEVIALYETIRDAVERAEQTLPAKRATEAEVVEAAKERYRITYSEVWPAVQSLAEKDLTEEALREMLEREQILTRASETLQGEFPSNTGTGTSGEEETEEGSTEAESDDKTGKGKATGKKGAGKASAGTEEEGDEGSEGQAGTGKDEETEGAAKDEKRKGEESKAEGNEESSDDTAEGKPSKTPKLGNLTPKQRRALQEHFDELSEEERRTLLEQAKERMKALETSIVQRLQSILSMIFKHDPKQESEDSCSPQEPMETAPSEPMRAPQELAAARLRTQTEYDKVHEQVRQQEQELYLRLLPLFRPRTAETMELRSTGNGLNMGAVFRRASAKAAGSSRIDHRIFERQVQPTVPDDAHTILLDLSGSMRTENKIFLAFSTVVLYSEVFSRLGVQLEVLGFQDELIIFKEAHEALSLTVREKMSGMLLEPYGKNPDGHNYFGNNDDGPCLLKASERLQNIHARRRFLHVFSDGLPAGRYSNADDLRKAVATITEQGEQALIGYGIGPGTAHVERFYPVSLPSIPLEDFVQKTGDVLSELIYHPDKYGVHFR